MIEVLIAILVSVIGLFSVMKMQLTAVSNNHSSYFRSQAAIISNALIDQLRANSTSALAGNYDLTLTQTPPIQWWSRSDRFNPVAHRSGRWTALRNWLGWLCAGDKDL